MTAQLFATSKSLFVFSLILKRGDEGGYLTKLLPITAIEQ